MFRALCPTRLVMAMTLAAIAMLMTSAGAQAHPGHDHRAQPAVTFAAFTPAAASKAYEAVPSVGQIKAQVKASALPATKDDAPRASNICLSGCCQPGGAGCLTVWIVSDFELPTPIPLRAAVNLTGVGGAGIKPDALPEPPNSLA